MGGYSSEYKISLISGNVVYQFLDKTKNTTVSKFIFSKRNGFMLIDNNNEAAHENAQRHH
jgi:D-alanine-D-alanine ligase